MLREAAGGGVRPARMELRTAVFQSVTMSASAVKTPATAARRMVLSRVLVYLLGYLKESKAAPDGAWVRLVPQRAATICKQPPDRCRLCK